MQESKCALAHEQSRSPSRTTTILVRGSSLSNQIAASGTIKQSREPGRRFRSRGMMQLHRVFSIGIAMVLSLLHQDA